MIFFMSSCFLKKCYRYTLCRPSFSAKEMDIKQYKRKTLHHTIPHHPVLYMRLVPATFLPYLFTDVKLDIRLYLVRLGFVNLVYVPLN